MNEHRTEVDATINGDGNTVFFYWCDACTAGSDNYPTKDEAEQRAKLHRENPDKHRDWSLSEK